MTVQTSGDLRQRVTFQSREPVSDGYGNEQSGPWTDRFTVWARIQPKLGGEDVIAARLAGTQPLIVTVRSSSDTRRVTPAWRAYDVNGGVTADGEPARLFDIRSSANLDERNRFIDFLVQEGQPG